MNHEKTLRWEILSPDFGVYIGGSHGFTQDTLLLAAFSAPKAGEVCGDFGTGCGTIPILWQSPRAPKLSFAVELQKEAADMAEASVRRNGLEEKIKVLCRDIRDYKGFFTHQSLDLVACNPPYKARGAGLTNQDTARRTARHEESMTPGDIAKAAAYTLKFGGRICICQRPERLTDFMLTFRAHGLEPKRLRLVQQNQSAAPSLFLLEAKRGGKSGLHMEAALLAESFEGYYRGI